MGNLIYMINASLDGYFEDADGRFDWLIAGGESGHGYRPVDVNWVRFLRELCAEAQVPFFFKQWGGRNSKANGRELDGRLWNEYPPSAERVFGA